MSSDRSSDATDSSVDSAAGNDVVADVVATAQRHFQPTTFPLPEGRWDFLVTGEAGEQILIRQYEDGRAILMTRSHANDIWTASTPVRKMEMYRE